MAAAPKAFSACCAADDDSARELFDECELRAGGGVGCADGGAGGVAACREAGVGVAAFGTATTSGVTGDGAGLLDANTPF